jgi:RNA polymerase sigma-70 factor (ECF subfamily)
MAETPEIDRDQTDLRDAGEPMRASELEEWFVNEVLPLEAALMQFLRYNWRNQADIGDLLQEIYLKVFEAAQTKRPDVTRPFVFATARNHLINHIHRSKIVPIEAVTDLESLPVATDEPATDQALIARDELRRVQGALDKLSPRSRQAILMKQVDGLSRREIAERMQISENTVKWYLSDGLRALANALYGEPQNIRGRT